MMKLPKPFRPQYHLAIPIGNRNSIAQIEKSLSHLVNDPLAAPLPHVAWRSVRQLRYPIHSLSLDNKELHRAIELLHSPECASILQQCRISPMVVHTSHCPPDSVTLRGLRGFGSIHSDRLLIYTRYLAVSLQDCTLNLPALRYRLAQLLVRHGLIKGQMPAVPEAALPSIKIMDTEWIRAESVSVSSKFDQWERKMHPQFDARDLVKKYQNHVWGENIALDKLSIYEEGLMDIKRHGTVIGQGYREVAKFPLPNISNEMLEVEDPEIEYSSAARTFRENMPVTAAWLSLYPQSELDRFKGKVQDKGVESTHGPTEYDDWVATLQPSSNGIFSCDKCGKPFKYRSGLILHQKHTFHVRHR